MSGDVRIVCNTTQKSFGESDQCVELLLGGIGVELEPQSYRRHRPERDAGPLTTTLTSVDFDDAGSVANAVKALHDSRAQMWQ